MLLLSNSVSMSCWPLNVATHHKDKKNSKDFVFLLSQHNKPQLKFRKEKKRGIISYIFLLLWKYIISYIFLCDLQKPHILKTKGDITNFIYFMI